MKHFAIFCLALGANFALDTIEVRSQNYTILSSAVESDLNKETKFQTTAKKYLKELEDIKYHARRYSAYFGYAEFEIMKGIDHLIHLGHTLETYDIENVEGREAFFQMKQPLSYVNQYIVFNRNFKHVTSMWQDSIKSYHKMVQLFTGKPVDEDSIPIDFNSPLIKVLQSQIEDLKEISQQFQYQMKQSLTTNYTENVALLAYVDQYTAIAQRLNGMSYSFITQRFEMEQYMKRATKASRQINAGLMNHQNIYLRQSWQVVRQKATIMLSTFNELMHPKKEEK
ncbi:MAG: hypothetical protein COB02_18330 [Candidatus Cloacimonadota bacterium]|nr:MAG: hypothetical protein COB02_18330 [Candidatus Cloacimonadota bacterium]